MNDKQRETLVIAQEECAEVIQEISKIFRFGIDNLHKDGMLHREKLEIEIGDLLTMFDLLVENNVIDWSNVEKAKKQKLEKLKVYSSLFKK